jgi:endonuclease/exonuclease/phosphatase family metal-dependent hydrolase
MEVVKMRSVLARLMIFILFSALFLLNCAKDNPAGPAKPPEDTDPIDETSVLECNTSILSFSVSTDTLSLALLNKSSKNVDWHIDSMPRYLTCTPSRGTLVGKSSVTINIVCRRDSLRSGVTTDHIIVKTSVQSITITTMVGVQLDPPLRTFTILCYNILEGAGADEWSAAARENNWNKKGNALEEVIDVINYYNPDIVGIQEAVRWNAKNDSIPKYVARKLGMNYLLAVGYSASWGVMLLTKYEILDYQLYGSQFAVGSLKARLKTPAGDTLVVYNFHLSVPAHHLDILSFKALTDEFKKTRNGIAMGDFNLTPTEVPFPDNWALAATCEMPDQIWLTKEVGLSASGEYYRIGIPPEDNKLNLLQISDHRPVVCKTGLY